MSNEHNRKYHHANREKINEQHHQYRIRNRDRLLIYDRKRRQILKQTVISHYSDGAIKCALCSFDDIRALSIDHINNDGYKHRKEGRNVKDFYRWLKNHCYPDGFQVLCMNCQFIKRHNNSKYELVQKEDVIKGANK